MKMVLFKVIHAIDTTFAAFKNTKLHKSLMFIFYTIRLKTYHRSLDLCTTNILELQGNITVVFISLKFSICFDSWYSYAFPIVVCILFFLTGITRHIPVTRGHKINQHRGRKQIEASSNTQLCSHVSFFWNPRCRYNQNGLCTRWILWTQIVYK